MSDELSELRNALAARVESCWDRLDDAVCELVALHGISPETIVAQVGESARAASEADAALSRSR